MPYRGRYNYRRRTYGKKKFYKKRTFSRFNTYRHRSSKAQAYQIYKLNKKLNYVYKMNKPEIQIYTDDTNNNGTPHFDINLTTSEVQGYKTGITEVITKNNGCFNGHYARIKDVTITGTLEYIGNPNETAQTQICGLRLIFFRLKADTYDPPSRTDVMKVVYNKPNNYYLNSPLEPGFSTRYKLVKDFRTVLTPTSGPTKSFKITFKYPYALLSKSKLESTGSYSFSKNSLWCVYYICRAGTYTGSSVDTFSYNGYLKFAYTDDTYTAGSDNAKSVKTDDADEVIDIHEENEQSDEDK